MTETADVMVITPHADDAELWAAGTVARWTQEGRRVVYVVCTRGDKGTSDRSLQPEALTKIREEEQLAAAKILGVQDVVFMRYPDQCLEDTPEFRKDLVRLIRSHRPETVVTVDPHRRYIVHRDHRVAGQVVIDAVFPFARDHLAYPDLLQDGLEPHKVKEMFFWLPEDVDINHRSDISSTFDLKITALYCHQSQLNDFKMPDLQERLRSFCSKAAQGETFELAESFHRVDLFP